MHSGAELVRGVSVDKQIIVGNTTSLRAATLLTNRVSAGNASEPVAQSYSLSTRSCSAIAASTSAPIVAAVSISTRESVKDCNEPRLRTSAHILKRSTGGTGGTLTIGGSPSTIRERMWSGPNGGSFRSASRRLAVKTQV